MSQSDEQIREQLEATVVRTRAAVPAHSSIAAPGRWALDQIVLGDALRELRDFYKHRDWTKYLGLFTLARAAYEAALSQPLALNDLERAHARAHLAYLLFTDLNGHREQAIAHCEAAQNEVAANQDPRLWATVEHHLARAVLLGVWEEGRTETSELERCLKHARRALGACSATAPDFEASVQRTIARVLAALGKARKDVALVDEAISTCGRALVLQPRERDPLNFGEIQVVLAEAYDARHELAGDIRDLRRAIAADHATLDVWHAFPFASEVEQLLTNRLKKLAETTSAISVWEWLNAQAQCAENTEPTQRLLWAREAKVSLHKIEEPNLSEGLALIAAIKAVAMKFEDHAMFVAWAEAIQAIDFPLGYEERSAFFNLRTGEAHNDAGPRRRTLHAELKAEAERLSSPLLSAKWAELVKPEGVETRTLREQTLILADIRACADRYGTPELRSTWAFAVAGLSEAEGQDGDTIVALLNELKDAAITHNDPILWQRWAYTACEHISNDEYCSDHLDDALELMVETKPILEPANWLYTWVKLARCVHTEFLVQKRLHEAGCLRAELKQLWEDLKTRANDSAVECFASAWFGTMVAAIEHMRFTDFAGAQELLAELEARKDKPNDDVAYEYVSHARSLLIGPD